MIKEKLLDIVPLKDTTRGINVEEAITAAFTKASLPIPKLTAIIAGSVPGKIGSANGLVGLYKSDQTFPEF